MGILRGWTDRAYDGYVCDLPVDPGCQKQGIGRELLARLISHYGSQVQWVLRASKIAAPVLWAPGMAGQREWMVLGRGKLEVDENMGDS